MAVNKPFPDRAAKTFQNKVLDGGVADSQHAIILPQNTTENLATIPNVVGSIAYDNEAQQIVVNKGTGFTSIGGGPTWTKYTLSFTAFKINAATKIVAVVTIPAKTMVDIGFINIKQVFDGGIGNTLNLHSYINGNENSGIDCSTLGITNIDAFSGLPYLIDLLNPITVAMELTIDDGGLPSVAVLNSLTAGIMEIYLRTTVLP